MIKKCIELPALSPDELIIQWGDIYIAINGIATKYDFDKIIKELVIGIKDKRS